MSYHIKEIYYTLQGEGAHTGRPAVFCRFAGCNLWSGREEDRSSAVCRFCDTAFVGTDGPGGGDFETAEELARAVFNVWHETTPHSENRFVVCTGGEPLLQLDEALIDALHQLKFEVAVETNGTLPPPNGIDWICMSPKAATSIVLNSGNELKLVFPQPGAEPKQYENLKFDYFFLQPMDGPHRETNTQLTIQYCLEHPQWRLSLQTHKLLGLP